MVFICREAEAAKTVFRYKNVAAFSVGKKVKKGFSDNKLEISYDRNTFIPDNDTINGVVDGSIKGNKVIKKAIKDLRNPAKAENPKDVMVATMIMNILTTNSKKTNIIVFVLDDEATTPEEKKREKFIIKYITAICEEFGITPITKMKKDIKKLFKGKKKKIGKKIDRWLRSGKSGKYAPSRATSRYVRRLITYYAIELHQVGLSDKDSTDLGTKERRDLARTLANVFTNDNMKKICETTKSKQATKINKNLRKKNKFSYKVYENTRKALKELSKDYTIPKAKFGYKGKGRKAKPKMDPNKFVEKLSKYKKSQMLMLCYMNISFCQLTGYTPGTDEWAKGFSKNLTDTFGKEFANAFISASKAQI